MQALCGLCLRPDPRLFNLAESCGSSGEGASAANISRSCSCLWDKHLMLPQLLGLSEGGQEENVLEAKPGWNASPGLYHLMFRDAGFRNWLAAQWAVEKQAYW